MSAQSQLTAAKQALGDLLVRYLSLANSGDCGFWDPEEEMEVRQARGILKTRKKGS